MPELVRHDRPHPADGEQADGHEQSGGHEGADHGLVRGEDRPRLVHNRRLVEGGQADDQQSRVRQDQDEQQRADIAVPAQEAIGPTRRSSQPTRLISRICASRAYPPTMPMIRPDSTRTAAVLSAEPGGVLRYQSQMPTARPAQAASATSRGEVERRGGEGRSVSPTMVLRDWTLSCP
jgi:hypothetical protein